MPKWNALTERYLSRITSRLKRRRVDLFVRTLRLGPDDVVLDLGSEDGSYLASYYPYPQNIVLADLFEEPMRRGVQRYGLKDYIVMHWGQPLPVDDRQFSAVWCNSVIEHVTVPRSELDGLTNTEFRRRAEANQRQFTHEIRRVARSYFVQTPNLHFPLEAHSWLPFVQYLPQRARLRLSRRLRRIWIKQWTADFLLYDRPRLARHFPDATAYPVEGVLGLTKSLLAVRTG